jgi:hypothetical protein
VSRPIRSMVPNANYRKNYDDIFNRNEEPEASATEDDGPPMAPGGLVEPSSKSQRKRLEEQRKPRPDSLGKDTI